RWLTAPQPGARARGGTFLINEIAAGQVVFTMETGGWADSLRRRARQAGLSTEEVAERAASAGAAALVTSTPPPRPDLPVLPVDDPRRALWALAAHARRRSTDPVVAVSSTAGTGSAPAMLQYVLSGTVRVHVPTGNWNTIDGVSFTLTGLLAPTDIAVLEMAHVGFVGFDDWSTPEMARPDVAVVTSIGQAHADLDATVEGTARLKARIFRGLHGQGTAVLNLDTPRSDILLTEATAHASRVITYGRHPHATLRLVDYAPVTG